eukprot:gene14136-16260_t
MASPQTPWSPNTKESMRSDDPDSDSKEELKRLLDNPSGGSFLDENGGLAQNTPTKMKPCPPTPLLVLQEMRNRVEALYPNLLASLDCSTGSEKVKMWDPSDDPKSEMYILLLRHNLSYRERQSFCTQNLTWDLPIACVLCHGGRVLIEVEGGDALQLLSVLFNGKSAEAIPFLTPRRSSHELQLIDDVFHETRACYAPCEGFNISFGGLGNHYDYKGGIIGPGGVGLQRTTFRKALDYFSGREQQGHVLVKWKNDTLKIDPHKPIGAILVGIETVDYRFKSGLFGQGHSWIGCSNAQSVTNGKKMAKFFEHGKKSKLP